MIDWTAINIATSAKKEFRVLGDYWESLRKEGKLPNKVSFNPMKIVPILSEICIMERTDPNSMVYRLSGTAHAERVGLDLTGKNVLDFFPDAAVRELVNQAYLESAEQKCGTYHQVELAYTKSGVSMLDCLYLPLCDDNDVAKYHICVFRVNDETHPRPSLDMKFLSFDISTIHYFDVGFGTRESLELPKHTAIIT